MNKVVNYPALVICIDGEPMVETDGTITLYQEGDDSRLRERFLAIVELSQDPSRATIQKFTLKPRVFKSQISREEFLKKAQKTYDGYK